MATGNHIIERATDMETNTMANTINQLSSPPTLDLDTSFTSILILLFFKCLLFNY